MLMSFKSGGKLVLLSVLLILVSEAGLFRNGGGAVSSTFGVNKRWIPAPATNLTFVTEGTDLEEENASIDKGSLEDEEMIEQEADAVKFEVVEGTGKSGEHERMLSQERIREKISALSPLRGFQNKTGVLPPEKWLPKFRRSADKKFMDWKRAVISGNESSRLADPSPFPECWVHVNHDYRFIWVKVPKTGGSSLKHRVGWGCINPKAETNLPNAPFCSQRAWFEEAMKFEDAKEWWKDYFVFTIIRNPYSRFASGYGFVNRSIPKKFKPRFDEVCRDPFLQGKICVKDDSCASSIHSIHHIQPQASCLFSTEGGIAVDYIGHTETLDEDYRIIAAEINKRLTDENVPSLNTTAPVDEANANHKFPDGYSSLFADNPGCLEAVESYLKTELQLLGYSV